MNLSKKIVSVILSSLLIFQLLFLLLTPVLAQGATVNMEYDNRHPLHAPKKVNSIESQYDANGNLKNDGERIISWNQDNLPTKIERNSQIVEFFYDADGRRIVKKVGQDKTIYVNKYSTIEQLNNETIPQKYYFANSRIAQDVSDNLSFLHQNYIGSTVLATDSNSQTLGEILSYFPYGNYTKYQIPNTKYQFTGQELDSESDLYNYNARLYNPKTGSFISPDILGQRIGNSQGLNLYSYVVNNPLRYIDPSGLFIPGEDPDPEDMLMWIEEFRRKREKEKSPLEQILSVVSEIPEEIRREGITSKNWNEVASIFEDNLTLNAFRWFQASIEMYDVLQCLALFGSFAEEAGAEVPALGEGPHEFPIGMRDFDPHTSDEIQKGLWQVEPGDILFYKRKTGPDTFSSHWAIITEVTTEGAKLLEAMGEEFKRGMGTKGEIYAGPGGILINERTFNFESGTVEGANIINWGVYRINPKK